LAQNPEVSTENKSIVETIVSSHFLPH